MLPLATQRLVVREFTGGDLDQLATVYADPAVLWWQDAPNTREQTAEALERILARYRADGMAEYAVVLKASGEVIGDCGPAYREIEGKRLPELGWTLRSDCWGYGYATEAARGALTHAAGIGLRRVYALITPANVRSRGVARKLGMAVERRVVFAERPHDLWALDLPAPAGGRATMDPPHLDQGR
jgi:ribosomal-protein-alanine N-acetyltransferase